MGLILPTTSSSHPFLPKTSRSNCLKQCFSRYSLLSTCWGTTQGRGGLVDDADSQTPSLSRGGTWESALWISVPAESYVHWSWEPLATWKVFSFYSTHMGRWIYLHRVPPLTHSVDLCCSSHFNSQPTKHSYWSFQIQSPPAPSMSMSLFMPRSLAKEVPVSLIVTNHAFVSPNGIEHSSKTRIFSTPPTLAETNTLSHWDSC